MKISILCTNAEHPINCYLYTWIKNHRKCHDIQLARNKNELKGGDILFLISCHEILLMSDLSLYQASLVIHASDVPKGRGWSPHIWEIASGASYVTLTLLEAREQVDSGRIWKKKRICIPNDVLWDEINHIIFEEETKLMDFAIDSLMFVEPEEQRSDVEPTYYKKRTPQDSRIDPKKTIAEQFDLIRVCDPIRFPAFFDYRGHRYLLKLEKCDDE